MRILVILPTLRRGLTAAKQVNALPMVHQIPGDGSDASDAPMQPMQRTPQTHPVWKAFAEMVPLMRAKNDDNNTVTEACVAVRRAARSAADCTEVAGATSYCGDGEVTDGEFCDSGEAIATITP